MNLKVIHFYKGKGNLNLEDDLANGKVEFITITGLCTNTVEVWELVKGQLLLCEMYSKFDEDYERSDSEYFFTDNKKTFHDWINCEVLIPISILPYNHQFKGTHLRIDIANGYLQDFKPMTIYDELEEGIF